MTSDADDRLLAPYRPVRRVGRGEAPWPGMLVRVASGESLMLVDATEFAGDWAGWRADPEGHLLAPVDVVRHAEGHSLALPVCGERVQDFLTRRAAAQVPLSIGETVTVGVSLIRGVVALDAAADVRGEWWLTDAGRPVLAVDASEHDAASRTAELLRTLAGGSSGTVALLAAAEAVGSARRSAHDLRLAEERLFAAAPPEPILTSLLGPRAARDLRAFDRDPIAGMNETDRAPAWVDALARHVDADLADVVSRATTGVWRTLRTPRSRSRKPWLLAACAAAAVLAGGLLWPTGAAGPATADVHESTSAGAAATSSASPTAQASSDPAATGNGTDAETPADLVAITNRLLESRSACGDDESCLAAVMLDPVTRFEGGPIDLEPQQRATTLLDDFGGVAVLRVDALDGTQAPQMVVVMLDDDRWLLRDVHAAKQP